MSDESKCHMCREDPEEGPQDVHPLVTCAEIRAMDW